MQLFFLAKNLQRGLRLGNYAFKLLFFNHKQYVLQCLGIATTHMLITALGGAVLGMPIALLLEAASESDFFFLYKSHTILEWIIAPILMITASLLITFFQAKAIQTTLILIRKLPHPIPLISFRLIITLIPWVLLNSMVTFTLLWLGVVGTILAFLWQLLTSFVIPSLLYHPNKTLYFWLKNSISVAYRRFENLVGVDLLIEVSLLSLTLFMTYFDFKIPFAMDLRTYSSAEIIAAILSLFIISYILAVVTIGQIIFTATLYATYKNRS
jgi:hypothetical protein